MAAHDLRPLRQVVERNHEAEPPYEVLSCGHRHLLDPHRSHHEDERRRRRRCDDCPIDFGPLSR